MGTVRKTITLTDKRDSWSKSQIDASHDTNDREYNRDLIRREQARSAEVDGVRATPLERETDGEPSVFEVVAFNQRRLNSYG